MVVGSTATLTLYVVAAILLRSGPSQEGYDVLLVANRLAVLTAAFAAALQVLAALAGAPGTRERTLVSALLAVTTAAPVAAVGLLGSQLVGMLPAGQPVALDSMLLAMVGVGQDVAPVPAVFAAAAVMLAVTAWRRRRSADPSAITEPSEALVRA